MFSRTVCAGCSKHELPASGVCSRTEVHSQGGGRGPEVKHSQKSSCASAGGLGVAVAVGYVLVEVGCECQFMCPGHCGPDRY